MPDVSVIIPVYNAQRFVEEACKSALNEPEVREVILVEDCSLDDSLGVCRQLVARNDRVKLYQHEGGLNRGAGVSRNLGICRAAADIVAFLDADDYYVPLRFKRALEILARDPSLDGVYEATGTAFDSIAAEERWYKYTKSDLTTMSAAVPPEDLFETLVEGGEGYFHCDALTVRRRIFEKAGLFDADLRLRQDMHMWIKIAATAKLVPGNLTKPVAMRRMHGSNRTTCASTVASFYACMQWRKLFAWSINEEISCKRQNMLLKQYLSMTEYHYMSFHSWRLRKLLGLARIPYVVARWPCSLRMKALKEYIQENITAITRLPGKTI